MAREIVDSEGDGFRHRARFDVSEDLLRILPVAVYVCDAEGRILRFNPKAAELWGREPAIGERDERFCGSHRLFWPDGRPLPLAETPMATALKTGVGARDGEAVIERPDGSRVTVSLNIEPLRNGAGEVIGAVNCFQDITQRKSAEEERRRAHQALEDFFESAAVPLHWVGRDGVILRANRAELELLGYAPEEYVGKPIADFHADAETIAEILARLARGETLVKHPARLRAKDGTIKHVLVTSNVRFEGGGFSHTRCFTVDVTESRRAEERQQLLLRELDHRVKNTLAKVIGMFTQSRLTASSFEDFVPAFEGRLMALARTHELLTQNAFGAVPIGVVVERELAAFAHAGSAAIAVEGPSLRLAASAAQALGMALHELATNAAKHGALAAPGGRVRAAWTETPEGVRFSWAEANGPPVAPPARRGFGRHLLEQGIAMALAGEARLEFAAEGLRYELSFPAAGNLSAG
jgi:PAS domain S-box-containing protein